MGDTFKVIAAGSLFVGLTLATCYGRCHGDPDHARAALAALAEGAVCCGFWGKGCTVRTY